MKIVWIDDDVANLVPQQELLRQRGYVVEVIDNVDDAWVRVTSDDPPDYVILDIMMATGRLLRGQPTKGGLTAGTHFLKKLEESGKLSRIKLIIYSIVADPDTIAEADRLGISFYKKQSAPGRRLVDVVATEFGDP